MAALLMAQGRCSVDIRKDLMGSSHAQDLKALESRVHYAASSFSAAVAAGINVLAA